MYNYKLNKKIESKLAGILKEYPALKDNVFYGSGQFREPHICVIYKDIYNEGIGADIFIYPKGQTGMSSIDKPIIITV